MIDFRMYTFLAVCNCLNFTKAAKELNITQPAVTQHIKFLASDGRQDMPLKFGTTMTIGEFVIGEPLSRYIKAHPDSDVTMVLSNTSDLLTKLKNGEIHFALVEGYFDSDEYAFQTYSTEQFIPVCAVEHQFTKEPEVLKDLLTERIIIREPGSGTNGVKLRIQREVSIVCDINFSFLLLYIELMYCHLLIYGYNK